MSEKYESKVEVDMTPYTSERVKELRSLVRECQSQMEYLSYKHNLYADKCNEYKKEYFELLGVKND